MAYTCPETLSSHMHKHTLTLVDFTGYRSGHVCDVCSQPAKNELVYQCKPCGFDVHPLCTLIPRKLKHTLHPNHQLVLQPSTSKSCAFCRGVCTSWEYSCKSCGFHIHPECALENLGHSNSNTKIRAAATLTPHPVHAVVPRGYASITSASQDKPKGNQITSSTSAATAIPAQRLWAEVSRTYARVRGVSQDNLMGNQITFPSSGPDTVTPQDDAIGHRITFPTSTSLASFMHKHILTLVDFKGYHSGRVCDVSSQPTNELVYQCKACEVDVHPVCTLIPRKLKHVLHPNHQLVLQPSTTKSCAVCHSACTHWRYSCKSCGFHIHPKCALESLSHSNISDAMSTTQKEHVEVSQGYPSVTSAPQDNHKGQQIICPTSVAAMVTPQPVPEEAPRVYAPVTCATQDKQEQMEVSQGYASVTSALQDNPVGHQITCPTSYTLSSYMHKHILTLMDFTSRRNSRICDVCSQKVNELVYQCKPCGFDVHPLCTLFPKQLRHALHPSHQLILQSSTTKPCAVCRGACTSWRYSCKSCGFHIHPECVSQTSSHSNSNTNNRAQPVQAKVARGNNTSVTNSPQNKPMGHQITFPTSASTTLNPQRVQAQVPQGYSTSVTTAPLDYFNYSAPNGNVPHYYYSQYSNSGNYQVQGNGGIADNLSDYGGKVMYDIVQDLASGVISDVIFGAFNLNFS